MIHYADNAYPSVSLHDMSFVLKRVGNDLRFYFLDGFVFEKNRKLNRSKKGMLVIKNCSTEDMSITLLRHFSVFGKNFVRGKKMSLSELKWYLKGSQLVVVDEYYSYNRLLWKCFVSPFKHLEDIIEIEIYHQSPVEYYISKKYRNCED